VQTQNVRHVYGQSGTYSVTLANGSFQVGQSLSVPLSSSGGASFALSATKGAVSYSAVISATSTADSTCSASNYTLSFGDGEKTTLDYPATCGVRVRTINHTYPEAGQYTISVSDSATTITSLVFPATIVAAVGAGDPYIATYLHADGADGSTSIVDSAPTAHAWTAFGNAAIDGLVAAQGSGSLYFDGNGDYLSTGASNDFNPFTIDLWFAAGSFPSAGTQAALIQQANASGQDTSFGGAGLELFGDQLYFVGTIGGTTYHPYYNNAPHSGSLTPSRWYHAAVVRYGNTVTLYLDGKKQGQIVVAGAACVE
jgi:hypothetical protein